MHELKLLRPSAIYEEQVMSYREEMLQNGDSFDGCAGLEDVQTFAEWIDFENRLKEKYKSAYVPSEVFLAVRPKDNCVVGIIDYRHPLTDFLFNFGGNIGYTAELVNISAPEGFWKKNGENIMNKEWSELHKSIYECRWILQ